jgi:hypothetical protein
MWLGAPSQTEILLRVLGGGNLTCARVVISRAHAWRDSIDPPGHHAGRNLDRPVELGQRRTQPNRRASTA